MPKPRILLVEDNFTNQEVVVAMLEDFDYELHVAETGPEALRMLAQQSYALILMDCHLPGQDGYSITEHIRAQEKQAGAHPIPIIAVTANAGTADRTRCLEAGMTDYLSKPFTLQQLLDVLSRHLPIAA